MIWVRSGDQNLPRTSIKIIPGPKETKLAFDPIIETFGQNSVGPAKDEHGNHVMSCWSCPTRVSDLAPKIGFLDERKMGSISPYSDPGQKKNTPPELGC